MQQLYHGNSYKKMFINTTTKIHRGEIIPLYYHALSNTKMMEDGSLKKRATSLLCITMYYVQTHTIYLHMGKLPFRCVWIFWRVSLSGRQEVYWKSCSDSSLWSLRHVAVLQLYTACFSIDKSMIIVFSKILHTN